MISKEEIVKLTNLKLGACLAQHEEESDRITQDKIDGTVTLERKRVETRTAMSKTIQKTAKVPLATFKIVSTTIFRDINTILT
jgi:hypothetical protein